MKLTYIISLLLLTMLASCYKELIDFSPEPDQNLNLPLILRLNHKDCFLDDQRLTLRYSIAPKDLASFTPYTQFQDYTSIFFEEKELKNNAFNNLGDLEYNKNYAIKIYRNEKVYHFTLSLTNLPIVRVTCKKEVIDERKTIGRITINYPAINSLPLTSFIGIEYRGGTSIFYDKKSYGFEFLSTNDLGSETAKSPFDFPAQEDWILDAMYVDQGRCRNALNFDLWQQMNDSYSAHHYAIATQPVEVHLNHKQIGLFSFNQQMSPEKIGLFRQENAVLYKAFAWNGGPAFDVLDTTLPPPLFDMEWNSWEQKYPSTPKWAPLLKMRYMAVHGTNTAFNNNIAQQVDLDLLADYYIFINLTQGIDNLSKNIIWLKQNENTPFQIIPWDTDATWGRSWDGTYFSFFNILSNNLLDRLIQNDTKQFRAKLKSRWVSLRQNLYTETKLLELIDKHFIPLTISNIISLENSYQQRDINLQKEKTYMQKWLNGRLVFMDDYFNNL